jgi:hypothetical protein
VDGTSYLRHVGQYDRYPYYPGGYTNENASQLLYRWITWLGNAMNYDGLRLDAGKHTPYEFFGWRGLRLPARGAVELHPAPRLSISAATRAICSANDRDRTNAFIFAEILSPWGGNRILVPARATAIPCASSITR